MNLLNNGLLAGCVTLMIGMLLFVPEANGEDKPHTPEQGHEISIDMPMNTAPQLGQPTAVIMSVTSQFQTIKQLSIELILPPEVVLLKSVERPTVDTLKPNSPVSNSISFITHQAGQYKITAKVSGWTEEGQFKDRYEYLFFTVDQDPQKSQLGWSQVVQDEDVWSPSEKPELTADDRGFVSIPAADDQLNFTTIKIPAAQYYGSNELNGSGVTISGRYQFRNREDTANLGFNRNLMRLVNSTTGAHLSWTYADSNGNFTFPQVTNPGADGMRVRAYAVRYISGNTGYGVCEYPSCDDLAASDSTTFDQFFYRQTAEFTTADGNQDIGTYTSGYSLTNNLRAIWIYHDMIKAYDHLVQNTSIRGPFTAEWAADSTHGNHYHRDGNIHFKSDVGDGTNHTILHEIGHNVMFNAGTFPAGSDCPSPHFMNRVSGTQCAWTEGWAHIFLTLVNDQPLKCSPPSTTNCTLFETDPSFSNCDNGWDCGNNSDQVEGHVAGAVWDIYDNSDDDFDIESFNRNQIYDIVETDTNDSFASFWTSWLNDGNSDLALNSLFQNDIIYGDVYDIRVNNPSVDNNNPNINQTITVNVGLRNLGDISSIATNINYYLSNNEIISNQDQLRAVDFRGVLDKNLAVFSTRSFSINTPGNYWVGACFSDLYGFDPITSNNCTDGVSITVVDNDLIFESSFE